MTKGADALRTAREKLERHTRDERPIGNAHCMLKYFSPKDYAEVEDPRVKQEAAQRTRSPEQRGSAAQRCHGAEEADR